MINGREYAWEDIEVVVNGTLVVGVQAISYTSRKSHENIYGRGAKPIAMVRGKEEFEGSITLLQTEVERIQRSLPRGRNITHASPFNITVAYNPNPDDTPDAQLPIVVDTLIGCRFNEVGKSHGTEEMNMTIELAMTVFDIEYNVGGN
ncbi:MAG: hypothetical protein ACPGJS_05450 [Flammeovirgaceae bacterium]